MLQDEQHGSCRKKQRTEVGSSKSKIEGLMRSSCPIEALLRSPPDIPLRKNPPTCTHRLRETFIALGLRNPRVNSIRHHRRSFMLIALSICSIFCVLQRICRKQSLQKSQSRFKAYLQDWGQSKQLLQAEQRKCEDMMQDSKALSLHVKHCLKCGDKLGPVHVRSLAIRLCCIFISHTDKCCLCKQALQQRVKADAT